EVSLFLDPDAGQIEAARRLGAQAVEIQTARYSEARGPADRARELAAPAKATEQARGLGLHGHMGHGLNYTNLQARAAPPGGGVEELRMGGRGVARGVVVGMEGGGGEMGEAIGEGGGLRQARKEDRG